MCRISAIALAATLFMTVGSDIAPAVAANAQDAAADQPAGSPAERSASAATDTQNAKEKTVAPAKPRPATGSDSAARIDASSGDSESIFSEAVRDVLLDPLVLAPTRHPKRGITTRGVRPEERDAYYFILDFARKADQRLLKRAARELIEHRLKLPEYERFRENPAEFPVYYDLFRHPEVYHGKPVTLRGHIRKLISYPADENEYGIERLYEAWLYTPDSQTNPAVVVCTEIPKDIPTGGDILVDRVSVTGYYFKNFGYTAQDKPRFAPMILAARLEWHPEETAEAPLVPPAVRNTLVVLALVLILVLLYRYERRDEQKHAELQRKMLLENEPATAVIPPTPPNSGTDGPSDSAAGSDRNSDTAGTTAQDSPAGPGDGGADDEKAGDRSPVDEDARPTDRDRPSGEQTH